MNTKKKKTTKFKNKNAKNWIYVTNLPLDTNEQEVTTFFQKVGVLDLDPETQKPKIKLYRHTHHEGGYSNMAARTLKGDASICYARPESVELAITLLDDTPFRIETAIPKDSDNENNKTQKPNNIKVQKAKFEQHGKTYESSKKKSISNKKRQVARLAALQAIGWDDSGENGRITGGLKGLRIIVLKHVFTLDELNRPTIQKTGHKNERNPEDEILEKIEHEIREECTPFGNVEKITIFSKNVQGIVIVKFSQPTAASEAIKFYNGRKAKRGHGTNNTNGDNASIQASYWDGVTDYTVRDEAGVEAEAKKRLDDFGNWLDQQDLPEEFQLNVET
mmetsp:Transcript_5743/g.6248  ORF Transcript_5743/g.6248 Transcript_5743/m.6248 type:complete len:334 (+) Transcript_5743:180-1181(+)